MSNAAPQKSNSDVVHNLMRTKLQLILSQLSSEVFGAESVVELSLASLIAGGHVLLEGPPGIGKTSLAKSFAKTFSGSVSRVQMTSDLLPGEIMGVLRLNPQTRALEFRQGPIFANFVLADELNRSSPKTQAALLEAMSESTVTVDGQTYPLPQPFFVIATQNPFESHGVFPLAESQLDRFSVHVQMSFPDARTEKSIFQKSLSAAAAGPATEFKTYPLTLLHELSAAAQRVHIEESLLNFVVTLTEATRADAEIHSGISVRGGLQYLRLLQALALIRGRDFVAPTDLHLSVAEALSHRISLQSRDASVTLKQNKIRALVAKIGLPR